LLILGLVGLTLVVFASAQTSISHAGDQTRGRELLFEEVDDHTVWLRALWSSEHHGRVFSWVFTTNGFVRWRARFFRDSGDSLAFFTYRVALFRIVEFNVTDLTNGVDRSKVLQSLSLLNLGSSWSDIEVSMQPLNGVEHVYFNTSVTVSGVTVTLSHYLPASLVALNVNATLVPNALKMDIQIDNWSYMSPTSRLALVFGFCARDVRQSYSTNSNPVSMNDEGAVAIGSDTLNAFMWSRRIFTRVGGAATNTERIIVTRLFSELLFIDWVVTGANETTYQGDREIGETQDIVLFVLNTTNQPNHVVWDPYVGMSAASKPLAVPLFAVALLALMALALHA